MRRTIWKQPIEIIDEQTIEVPACSIMRHVALQGESMCLWFECTPDSDRVRRKVRIVGTGHPIDFDLTRFKHVGTVLTHSQALVWHVYVEHEGAGA